MLYLLAYVSRRRYFGEKTALYFAWLGFYTSMLSLPAAVGVLTTLYGLIGMTSNTPTVEICDRNIAGNIIMCPACNKTCPYDYLRNQCTFSMDVVYPEYEARATVYRLNPVTMLCLVVCSVFAIISYRIISVGWLSRSPQWRSHAHIATAITASLLNLVIILLMNKHVRTSNARLRILTQAFQIAYTSDFIPRFLYRVLHSPDYSLRGFINFTLSSFDTSDFDNETRPDNSTLDGVPVRECRLVT
ncbi:hypothetical protein V5799_000085 [Amblyomma americanum]|uniref:Anoctamin n=1 Tax=Amblyomma americanum TaxID=6943 RepID=A0AAQ4D422_AMBAM